MFKVTNLTGFNSGVDSKPPNITSASSLTVDSGATFSFSVTTDELSTITIGGADAALFELVSSDINTSHSLRWASNGTQTYSVPNDADANNVYEITLTPTDAAGNVGTAQNFSVSVDYEYTDSFVSPQGAGSANVAGITQRQLIGAAALSASGAKVRLIFEAAAVETGYGGFTIDAMYIGQQAASGDPYDMEPTTPAPVQVTFNGGSTSVTCAAGATAASDAIDFAIDETKSYIISTHFASPSGINGGFGITGVEAYSKSAVNEAATADVTGYTGTSGTTRGLLKVQVTTP